MALTGIISKRSAVGRRLLALAALLGLVACGGSGSGISEQSCPGLALAREALPVTPVAAPSAPDARMDAALGVMMRRVVAGRMPAAREGGARPVVEISLLAMSTGGQYGAFSSGLLSGWSASGTRPDFTVVTGASAGGLIAPVIFAGPAFDPALRLNTGVSDRDLIRPRFVSAFFGGAAFYDTGPLERRVRSVVDDRLIDAIAAQKAARRELVVGATNVDSGRFEILDIGAVANASALTARQKRDCVTEAVMATSAIPGLFPPRRINGALFADAGVREHIFLDGIARALREAGAFLGADIEVTAYLVINSDLRIREQMTTSATLPLVRRNFELVIDQGLRSSVLRSIDLAERSGWRLRGVVAPREIAETCRARDAERSGVEFFSPCVTDGLFRAGFDLAKDGAIPWLGPRDLRQAAQRF